MTGGDTWDLTWADALFDDFSGTLDLLAQKSDAAEKEFRRLDRLDAGIVEAAIQELIADWTGCGAKARAGNVAPLDVTQVGRGRSGSCAGRAVWLIFRQGRPGECDVADAGQHHRFDEPLGSAPWGWPTPAQRC